MSGEGAGRFAGGQLAQGVADAEAGVGGDAAANTADGGLAAAAGFGNLGLGEAGLHDFVNEGFPHAVDHIRILICFQ